jgi:hypothetical protein
VPNRIDQGWSQRTHHRACMLLAVLLVGVLVGLASPASADTTYNPPSGTWNGEIIFLSQACHDGNDDVPGGPCITNYGCNSYSENAESAVIAVQAILGSGPGWNLLERGYKVIRGTGTVGHNISASNSAGADLHVPLHTNGRTENCSNSTASLHGTQVLYVSTSGSACATDILTGLGSASPGTSDQKIYRTNLGELNSTTAVACYLEADYHTWNLGVSWILDEVNWTWRLGYGIDTYLGYP